jgi:hypothetical protein
VLRLLVLLLPRAALWDSIMLMVVEEKEEEERQAPST